MKLKEKLERDNKNKNYIKNIYCFNIMKRISSWHSSKLLTTSSFFFTIPGIYSYVYFNLIYSPVLLLTTSLISANFWRDALDDWRRHLDLVFSKLSFSYFVGLTLYHVPWKLNLFIALPNLGLMSYCYNKSAIEHEKNNKSWKYWHLGFHSLMMGQLFITMTYVGKNYLQIKNKK